MTDTLSKSMLKRHAVQMGVDMTDKQREAFEAYQIKIGMATYLHYEKDKQQYGHIPMQKDWRLWQAALAHSQWQPIETAPKNGRKAILLWSNNCSEPQKAYSNTWWTSGFSAENKPTHWMPLPQPPITNRKD